MSGVHFPIIVPIRINNDRDIYEITEKMMLSMKFKFCLFRVFSFLANESYSKYREAENYMR